MKTHKESSVSASHIEGPIVSCCASWMTINEVIKNPINTHVHFCKDRLENIRYDYEDESTLSYNDGDCIGRKDGSFWIVNSEYCDTQVSFCPHCGAKAPNQNVSELY